MDQAMCIQGRLRFRLPGVPLLFVPGSRTQEITAPGNRLEKPLRVAAVMLPGATPPAGSRLHRIGCSPGLAGYPEAGGYAQVWTSVVQIQSPFYFIYFWSSSRTVALTLSFGARPATLGRTSFMTFPISAGEAAPVSLMAACTSTRSSSAGMAFGK